jgi:long-chain fatty acid transport protein
MSRIRYVIFAAVFTGLLFTGGPAWAGGFYLNEYGTPSSGTAQAGAEAVARDASTVWHNPAGMTRVEGSNLMLGVGTMFVNSEFDPEPFPITPIPGTDGGSLDTFVPAGGLYFTHAVNDRLSVGLSLGGITGASLEYDDNWVGRFMVQSVEMILAGAQPSVAYKVNDWLSIGGGAIIAYGDFELTVAVPAFILPPSGGQAKVDGDDWVFGYSAGVLIEPSERLRFGVIYRSELEPEFGGDLTITPTPVNLGSDLELTLAQTVRGGAYLEVSDKVALLCSAAWEDWSALDNVFLNTEAVGAQLPRNWDDTWHVSGGVHFRPREDWLLLTGFSYDSSRVDDEDRTPDMPMDRQWKVAAGAQKDLSERLTLGGQFAYVNMGDAKLERTGPVGVTGEYDPNEIYVFAVNANWRF